MITTTSPLNATNQPHYRGGDQARSLRALVEQATRVVQQPLVGSTCHSIVVAGGKGGTGRSVIATNLAISLAKRGSRVGLIDASPDFGSVGTLCGVNGYWRVSHLQNGCRRLSEIVLPGPGGIQILSGGADIKSFGQSTTERDLLAEQLDEFENGLDWLVVDASGGGLESSRAFVRAADDLLIVATPEPTSIAEAYATVKTCAPLKETRVGLLVNQAETADQAQRILDRLQQAAHSFLQIDLHRRGSVSRDQSIAESVSRQVPVVMGWPDSSASQSLLRLAQRWTRQPGRCDKSTFMKRVRNL